MQITVQIISTDADPSQLSGIGTLIEKALSGAYEETEFTGEEIGSKDFFLFFDASNPRALLRDLVRIARKWPYEGVVRIDGITQKEVAISLRNLEEWLRSYRHKASSSAIKIGNIYAVPLADSTWGYVWYVSMTRPWGDFVQILDYRSEVAEPLRTVDMARLKGAPLLCVVSFAVRKCGWKLAGYAEVADDLTLPTYRTSARADLMISGVNYGAYRAEAPVVLKDWILMPGATGWVPVGELNEAQRKLEIVRLWPCEPLAARILTGENPDLIFG